MEKLILCTIFIAICAANMADMTAAQYLSSPVVIEQPPDGAECPAQELRDTAREEIAVNNSDVLHEWVRMNCGSAGGWRRVAYLNMTDPNQQCPESWREYTVFGERVCGRLYIESDWECDATFYSTDQAYSNVCGRIIGYRFDDPSGLVGQFDKVSLTYNTPRKHIWTFYGARYENQCNPPSNPDAFVDGDYFCEYDERLWDGEGCSNTNCAVNNPPWFLVSLPVPTTDDIEVEICGVNGAHDKDTPIQFMEVYVK